MTGAPTENLRVAAMTRVRPPPPVPPTIPLTDERRALILEHRSLPRPTPWREIGPILGVSVTHARRWGQIMGLNTSLSRDPVNPFDAAPEKRDELRRLWPDQTLSIRAIWRALEINRDLIRREAVLLDLGPRPPLCLPPPGPKPKPKALRPSAVKQKRDDEWPDERTALLLKLYPTGLSTKLMAARCDVTKSAVIGKIHRMKLPARAKPTGRDKEWWERRKAQKAAAPPPQRAPRQKPTIAAPPPQAAPVVPFMPRRSEPCCWVIGEPAGRRTRFCEVPSLPGKPLCAEHYAIAYGRAAAHGRQNRVTANAA
jgi:GcrA cell cycle regulator